MEALFIENEKKFFQIHKESGKSDLKSTPSTYPCIVIKKDKEDEQNGEYILLDIHYIPKGIRNYDDYFKGFCEALTIENSLIIDIEEAYPLLNRVQKNSIHAKKTLIERGFEHYIDDTEGYVFSINCEVSNNNEIKAFKISGQIYFETSEFNEQLLSDYERGRDGESGVDFTADEVGIIISMAQLTEDNDIGSPMFCGELTINNLALPFPLVFDIPSEGLSSRHLADDVEDYTSLYNMMNSLKLNKPDSALHNVVNHLNDAIAQLTKI